MKCPKCGGDIYYEMDYFCKDCGYKLNEKEYEELVIQQSLDNVLSKFCINGLGELALEITKSDLKCLYDYIKYENNKFYLMYECEANFYPVFDFGFTLLTIIQVIKDLEEE